jgi:hypothetical protein
MKTVRLRFADMTIKINAKHYQLNEEGGFSRFYKGLITGATQSFASLSTPAHPCWAALSPMTKT